MGQVFLINVSKDYYVCFPIIKKIWRSFSQEYRAYCLKTSDYVRFATDFYFVLLSNGFNGLKL